MLDSNFRSRFQPYFIDLVARLFIQLRLEPNQLTVCAMIFGVLCCGALACSQKWLALIMLLLSGLLDATDGTVARLCNKSSDRGCILDIVGDRLVEASVVLGLYLYEPSSRGWPALLLLASFYLCVTTFLLSGIFEKNRSNKAFHYSPGLIERGETFAFFTLVIIWPESFYWAAIIFAGLVFLTAFIRITELLSQFLPSSSLLTAPTNLDAQHQATTQKEGPSEG